MKTLLESLHISKSFKSDLCVVWRSLVKSALVTIC